MGKLLQVFCCYAHEDEALLNKLKKQLRPLQRQGLIDVWYDRNISAGRNWEEEINKHLNEANIILLLVSPDFMNSDYCYGKEMQRALERDQRGEARVIPIILRHVHWKEVLGRLKALPTDAKPVKSWLDEDEAYFDVTAGIKKAAEELIALSHAAVSNTNSSPNPRPPMQQETPIASAPRPRRGTKKKATGVIIAAIVVALLITGTFLYVNKQPFSHKLPLAATAASAAIPSLTRPLDGRVSSYDAWVAKNGMQFGFNAQHTRTNPYEGILNPDNVWKLQQKWAHLIGSDIDSSPPTVANGLVYVGSQDGKLYAFNASTGHQQWCASTGGAIDSSPAVANGLVYVGSQDGKLYAFNAATGQKKGSAKLESSTSSSPTIANGLLYIGSDNGYLYAFDTTMTGQSNWAPKWVAATNSSTKTGQKGIASSPAVANGLVYVSSRDGNLYAFNAATGGQPKWIASTKGIIDSSPAVANGLVYVGSQDGHLYAFDAATGKKMWRDPAPTGSIHDSSPAVASNLVYIGSWQYHNLYAFNAATGHQQWVASMGDAIYSSPVVANGLVYVGSFDSDGRLYAFKADGCGQPTCQPLWSALASSAPGKKGIDSSPAVANGLVYIGSRDGKLYAFSLP